MNKNMKVNQGPKKTKSPLFKISIMVMPLILGLVWRFIGSLRFGRIGGEPAYDDVSYLIDGRRQAESFAANFWKWAETNFQNPPHSPVSSAIAMVGYIIRPTSALTIYILNALIIVTFLFLLIYKITKSSTSTLLILGILVVSPIIPIFIFNFRPDCLYAIVLSYIVVFTLNSSIRSINIWLPLLFAFLIVIKPSFLLFTVLNFITIIFCLVAKNRGSTLNLINRDLAIGIGLSLPILIWFLPFGIPQISNYIYTNTVGVNEKLWSSGGIKSTIIANLRGIAYQLGTNFSLFFSILLVLIFRSFVSSKIVSRNKSRTILFFAALNFVIAVSSLIGNPFFYLPSLMLCVVFMLTVFDRLIKDRILEKFPIYILLFLVAGLAPSHDWDSAPIRNSGNINKQVAKLIENQNSKTVNYLFAGDLNMDTTHWFITPHLMEVEFRSYGLTVLTKQQVENLIDSTIKSGQSMIISRVINVSRFPSDEAQVFYNEELSSFVKNGMLKVKRLGEYYVWETTT
jgi:hypothetical protein